jgi:hypothetical protein
MTRISLSRFAELLEYRVRISTYHSLPAPSSGMIPLIFPALFSMRLPPAFTEIMGLPEEDTRNTPVFFSSCGTAGSHTILRLPPAITSAQKTKGSQIDCAINGIADFLFENLS